MELEKLLSTKVLVVAPSFNLSGGVANHYIGLTPYWKNNVRYVTCGRRESIPAFVTLVPDWINLLIKIISFRPAIVIVNPSLIYQPVFRDAINILIAWICGRKVVTFIHGWDEKTYKAIERFPSLFKWIYNKSKVVFVLYSGFKSALEKIGITTQIQLTSTKVADELVNNYKPHASINKRLLFLARVDYDKGLDITLKAFLIVKKKINDITLCVCGTGPYLQEAKQWVLDNNVKGVEFKGHVDGEIKKQCFVSSDIYILPTTHGEGMATSLLEAMAMGLVVLSRPVGGVVDFFDNEKMGYLFESVKPDDYANVIIDLYNNPDKIIAISNYNHEYACKNFLASKVAESIEYTIGGINKNIKS